MTLRKKERKSQVVIDLQALHLFKNLITGIVLKLNGHFWIPGRCTETWTRLGEETIGFRLSFIKHFMIFLANNYDFLALDFPNDLLAILFENA